MEVEITDFAKTYGLKFDVTDYDMVYFTVSFDDKGFMLSKFVPTDAWYGTGSTKDKAIANYCKVLRNKMAEVLIGEDWKPILVPKLIHTKTDTYNQKAPTLDLLSVFQKLRSDPNFHLGMGDIRLTIGQQEEIAEMVEKALADASKQ